MRQKGKKVILDQKSEEWLEWRNSGVGASESAIIKMEEEYPYSSNIQKLWAHKTGILEPEVISNKFTERGNELEPVAREIFIDRTGIYVEPMCYEHPYFEFIKASMDGITEDGEVICEIKCPSKPERHQHALDGKIPEEYYTQIQHQYLVTGAKMGYFVSYFPDYDKEDKSLDFKIIPVKPNYSFIEELQRKLVKFWQYVESRNLPVENAFSDDLSFGGKVGLVMISGYARAGKDTLGDAFHRVYKSKRFAFADHLKDVYFSMSGINDEEYVANKPKHRPFMVALGAGMRRVYPDVWVKGIFKPESGLYEAMDSYGAYITDVRYVNEYTNGYLKAKEMEVPHRLIWMEGEDRKVSAANEEEVKTTSLLKDMADVIVHNDMDIYDEKLRIDVFNYIVLRIYQGQTEIVVSSIVDMFRKKEGVGEPNAKKKTKSAKK